MMRSDTGFACNAGSGINAVVHFEPVGHRTSRPDHYTEYNQRVAPNTTNAWRRLGIEGVGLKSQNDLIWQQRKLGAMLSEMRGESAGPAQVRLRAAR
jgi:hypothetical protein